MWTSPFSSSLIIFRASSIFLMDRFSFWFWVTFSFDMMRWTWLQWIDSQFFESYCLNKNTASLIFCWVRCWASSRASLSFSILLKILQLKLLPFALGNNERDRFWAIWQCRKPNCLVELLIPSEISRKCSLKIGQPYICFVWSELLNQIIALVRLRAALDSHAQIHVANQSLRILRVDWVSCRIFVSSEEGFGD